MDQERFEILAEAYGAGLSRWPAAEQAEARAFLAERPEAAAILGEADVLDAALDAWRVPAPSAALRERVLAGAPQLRRARRGLRLWLSGAGFAAAATAAGMAFGMVACDAAVADVRADSVLAIALSSDTAAALAPLAVGTAGGT